MNFVNNTDLLMEEMTVKLNETKRSYVFETDDLFVITGFVVDDEQFFETVLKVDEVKYDEESLSNEERYEVLQQKELIDEFLDGGTQSVEDDMKIKEEREMCNDISTKQNQDCILMKERVEELPWTVMNSEELGDGERDMMLCSDQQNRWTPEEISTVNSESHSFETDYWCMTAGITLR